MSAPESLPPSEDEALVTLLAAIPAMTPEKLVKLFLRTREKKSEAQRIFDAQDAQFKRIMETCQNCLLAAADKEGVSGYKIAGLGTTYISTNNKISIADDSAFMAFCDTQEDKYGFFERRVAKKRVEDYMEAHEGATPPGLNIYRERTMNVRKASDK